MYKRSFAVFITLFACSFACGGERSESTKMQFKKTPKLSELKQKASDKTPEELAEIRKKAGFKSQEEVAAENAAMFEKGAKEYVKAHLDQYRDLTKDIRKHLDDIESSSKKWVDKKNAAKAVEKFKSSYEKRAQKLTKTYNELTGHGAEGGETQVILGQVFRSWEQIKSNLGPNLAKNEMFQSTTTTLREQLDKVDIILGDISNDASLGVAKNEKKK